MKQFFLYITALLALLLSFACDQEAMNSPEILKIKNYQITQQVICFCISPPAGRFYKLTVENGVIVKGTDLQDGSNLPSDNFDFFKTIAQLQEFVDSINPDSVAVFNVEYDNKFGFPSSIYVDFNQTIADEEIGYETRNFNRN